jgi:hypothetical protein
MAIPPMLIELTANTGDAPISGVVLPNWVVSTVVFDVPTMRALPSVASALGRSPVFSCDSRTPVTPNPANAASLRNSRLRSVTLSEPTVPEGTVSLTKPELSAKPTTNTTWRVEWKTVSMPYGMKSFFLLNKSEQEKLAFDFKLILAHGLLVNQVKFAVSVIAEFIVIVAGLFEPL